MVVATRTCAREGCKERLPARSAPQRKFCGHNCQMRQWRIEHPGEETDPVSRRKSLEEVIAWFAGLTEAGATQAEVAEALGISHSALRNALHRARAAGDPRAGRARPRVVKSSHKPTRRGAVKSPKKGR